MDESSKKALSTRPTPSAGIVVISRFISSKMFSSRPIPGIIEACGVSSFAPVSPCVVTASAAATAVAAVNGAVEVRMPVGRPVSAVSPKISS